MRGVTSSAVSGRWCTTCGDYVRAGTHGIHRMSFTGGAEVPGAVAGASASDTSDAAAVALVVFAIAGAGFALLGAAWLLYRSS